MRTKSLLFVFVLAVLSLLIGVQTAQAQVVVQEQQIMSHGTNSNYFQLANATGDSTAANMLGIDLTYTYYIDANKTSLTLYPDSVYIKWYTSADSTADIKIFAKARYTAGINASLLQESSHEFFRSIFWD